MNTYQTWAEFPGMFISMKHHLSRSMFYCKSITNVFYYREFGHWYMAGGINYCFPIKPLGSLWRYLETSYNEDIPQNTVTSAINEDEITFAEEIGQNLSYIKKECDTPSFYVNGWICQQTKAGIFKCTSCLTVSSFCCSKIGEWSKVCNNDKLTLEPEIVSELNEIHDKVKMIKEFVLYLDNSPLCNPPQITLEENKRNGNETLQFNLEQRELRLEQTSVAVKEEYPEEKSQSTNNSNCDREFTENDISTASKTVVTSSTKTFNTPSHQAEGVKVFPVVNPPEGTLKNEVTMNSTFQGSIREGNNSRPVELPEILNNVGEGENRKTNQPQDLDTNSITAEDRNENSASLSLVMTQLKAKFEEVYFTQCQWLDDIPWIAGTPQKTYFPLLIRDKRVGFNCLGGLDNIVAPGTKRIIIYGHAKFGKSMSCHYMARMWRDGHMKQFDLCALINLKKLELGQCLQDYIIEQFVNLLENDIHINFKDVQDILEIFGERILILLDDMDVINAKSLPDVMRLLATDRRFSETTVVVTSRPVDHDLKYNTVFDVQASILGFEIFQYSKLGQNLGGVELKKKDLIDFCVNTKIHFLTGLSPQISYDTLNVFLLPGAQGKGSLYELLQKVLERCTHRCKERLGNGFIESEYEEALDKLGYICLHALTFGQLTFKRNSFELNFCNYFKFLEGILTSSSPQTDRHLLDCPKVLAVFFATRFLRRRWESARSWGEKQLILKTNFCFDNSIGDFVLLTKGNPRYCFVGVLPEIILNLGQETSFESAVFEMYYDTSEAVELSNAFDSVNVLLRIEEKYLGRFGFEKQSQMQDSETNQNLFSDVIQNLNFDDCTTEINFYSNKYENLVFMEFCAIVSDDRSVAVQGVFASSIHLNFSNRLNGDGMFLEFRFCNVKYIIQFLKETIQLKSKNVSCPQYNDLGKFIADLLQDLGNSESKCPICITINESADLKHAFLPKYCILFYLTFYPENGTCKIVFNFRNLNELKYKTLSFEQFIQQKAGVTKFLNSKVVPHLVNPSIAIEFKKYCLKKK